MSRKGRTAKGVARTLLVLSAGVCLTAAGAAAAASDEVVPAARDEMVPAAVTTLLTTERDSGEPVVSDDERRYFDELPDHAKKLIVDAVGADLVTSAEQLAVILALKLSSQKLELLMQNNCVLCHSNPDYHDPETLFSLEPAAAGSAPHMDLRDVVNDVHFRHRLACAGCHGGDPSGFMAHDHPPQWPADRDARQEDRSWIPAFCDRCHGDAAYMRRFNPALPTDQLAKYEQSHHGELLLEEGDSRAAQCVSCHGVHGIQGANSPLSRVYPKNVSRTCGGCHADTELMASFRLADGSPMPTDQLEKYRQSVHGRALLERGDIGAPTCNDCHGNHAAIPPDVASVAQICRTCHAGNGSLFDGSKHKEAFERHGWPECGTCHGKHAIAATSDHMLGTGASSLCESCHAQHARDNPACTATAHYFHDTLTTLAAARVSYRETVADLAERGLDVEPITNELSALADSIKLSRSRIHAFNRSDFDEVAAVGREQVARLAELTERAEAEYAWRRRGLLMTIAVMAFLGVLFYLKLRRLERRQSRAGGDASPHAG